MRLLSDFFIVYATQTGNSKAIAERINDLSQERSLKSCVYSVDTLNSSPEFSNDCGCGSDLCTSHAHWLVHLNRPLVIVCSTTGEGDPPETARKFFRALSHLGNDVRLSNVHYALLGLGDTNYNTYIFSGLLNFRNFVVFFSFFYLIFSSFYLIGSAMRQRTSSVSSRRLVLSSSTTLNGPTKQ